jgi:hypothetical protein
MAESTLSESEVAEIRRRYQEATPEPWTVSSLTVVVSRSSDPIARTYGTAHTKEEASSKLTIAAKNANFIAHSRQDVPRLCDTIDTLRSTRAPTADAEEAARQVVNKWRSQYFAISQRLKQTPIAVADLTEAIAALLTEHEETVQEKAIGSIKLLWSTSKDQAWNGAINKAVAALEHARKE